MCPKAQLVSEVRGLADFIFAFGFHFISFNHFRYNLTPALKLLLVCNSYFIHGLEMLLHHLIG
jgi:hypothetical protein